MGFFGVLFRDGESLIAQPTFSTRSAFRRYWRFAEAKKRVASLVAIANRL
jgi:hypothetical protein